MQQFDPLFRQIKIRYDAQSRRDPGLICKQGFYGSCPVLKLQKASWTNDDMADVPNTVGIFFSIWLAEKSLKENHALYNIHALKMRQLADHRITSIDFAREFRKRFEKMQSSWPNVSIDYGPQTLMQGWVPIVEKHLDRDLMILLNRFGRVATILDELLEQRRIC